MIRQLLLNAFLGNTKSLVFYPLEVDSRLGTNSLCVLSRISLSFARTRPSIDLRESLASFVSSAKTLYADLTYRSDIGLNSYGRRPAIVVLVIESLLGSVSNVLTPDRLEPLGQLDGVELGHELNVIMGVLYQIVYELGFDFAKSYASRGDSSPDSDSESTLLGSDSQTVVGDCSDA